MHVTETSVLTLPLHETHPDMNIATAATLKTCIPEVPVSKLGSGHLPPWRVFFVVCRRHSRDIPVWDSDWATSATFQNHSASLFSALHLRSRQHRGVNHQRNQFDIRNLLSSLPYSCRSIQAVNRKRSVLYRRHVCCWCVLKLRSRDICVDAGDHRYWCSLSKVRFQWTAGRYIQESRTLRGHCCETRTSCIATGFFRVRDPTFDFWSGILPPELHTRKTSFFWCL